MVPEKLKLKELPGKEEIETHSAHNPACVVMEAPPVFDSRYLNPISK
jgi:hypothetical protein